MPWTRCATSRSARRSFRSHRSPEGRGPGRRGHWERGDFLGYLTARLNYVLYCWDPGRGAFSTLFCAHLVPQTFRMVVWIDRERYNRDDDQQKTALEAYAYERGQRYHLYRTPEDFRWEEQMLELLGDDPWGKLMFNIPERSRTVLEWRFRDGKTLRQVGALLGLTAERVRQIERDTLKAVRTRIERYEPARRLFFGEAA